MKILFSALLLTLFSTLAFAQKAKEETEPVVVAGKGWGVVVLGAKRKDVESVLGEGKDRSKYDDVYFVDYPEKGIQVSYKNGKDTLANVYFYNQQRRYENFSTASVKIDKGISWNSTPDELIKAYGKPKGDFDSGDMRRIVFKGIDFRFEGGKMVRIGIPGE